MLDKLIKSTTRSKKRVGRGPGSGKGRHTSGRGQKGQNARTKTAIWFEGGQLPLIRRTPFIKGKNRFDSLTPKAKIVTTEMLNKLPDKTVVDAGSLQELLKLKFPKTKTTIIKIVSRGKLKRALTVKLPTSKSAAKAIEKAGGEIQL